MKKIKYCRHCGEKMPEETPTRLNSDLCLNGSHPQYRVPSLK